MLTEQASLRVLFRVMCSHRVDGALCERSLLFASSPHSHCSSSLQSFHWCDHKRGAAAAEFQHQASQLLPAADAQVIHSASARAAEGFYLNVDIKEHEQLADSGSLKAVRDCTHCSR